MLSKNRENSFANSLAKFAVTSRFAKASKATQIRMGWCLADFIACAIAATQFQEAKSTLKLANRGSVKLPGLTNWSFTQESAALVMGTLGSLLQLHDGYGHGGNHPSSVLVPTLIAMRGSLSLGSNKALSKLAAGYEVCNRLSRLTHPSQSFTGSAPTGTMGAIGAAVTASLCMELKQREIEDAISIAAFLAPISTYEALKVRGSAVPFHSGIAARTGVEAAKLAKTGLSGGRSVLEGRASSPGLLDLLTGSNKLNRKSGGSSSNKLHNIISAKGFNSIKQVFFKPFPGCRHIQPAVEAVLNATGDRKIEANKISKINILTYPLAISFAKPPKPNNELYDRLMSIPWGIAATLDRGKPDINYLKSPTSTYPEELYQKIHISSSPIHTKNYPSCLGATAHITLKDKTKLFGEVSLEYGKPQHHSYYTPPGGYITPLKPVNMRTRFLELTTPAIGSKAANSLLRTLDPDKNLINKT